MNYAHYVQRGNPKGDGAKRRDGNNRFRPRGLIIPDMRPSSNARRRCPVVA